MPVMSYKMLKIGHDIIKYAIPYVNLNLLSAKIQSPPSIIMQLRK